MWTGYHLQYNRGRSREHLDLAAEYVATAERVLEAGNLRPAAENCLSGLALAANAARLQFSTPIAKRNPHRHLERWFHAWARAEGLRSDFARLLKDLNRRRKAMRFLDGDAGLDADFVAEALDGAKALIEDISSRVAIPWDKDVAAHLEKGLDNTDR